MTSLNQEKYREYGNKFLNSFKVDYGKMESTYLTVADSVGVYPDASFLLYTIASLSEISTIVEFGAGMSTCVLVEACSQYNKSFMSVESSTEWTSNVHQALRKLGHQGDYVVDTEKLGSPPELPDKVDFLWVDGHILNTQDRIIGRVEACEYYQEQLTDTLMVFDDAQWFTEKIKSWRDGLPEKDSYVSMWYNPTGREDRHLFILVPKSKEFVVELVKGLGGTLA